MLHKRDADLHGRVIRQPAEAASATEGARKDGLDFASAWAIIGIFVMMAIAAVYVMGPILIPLSLAVVTGLIFGLAAEKLTDAGIPPLPTALLLATGFGVGLFFIAGALVEPLSLLINSAPDIIRDTIDRLKPTLERIEWLNIREETFSTGAMSLESLVENTSSILGVVSAGVAPALLQALIFFFALVLFLSARLKLRRMMILAFPRRGVAGVAACPGGGVANVESQGVVVVPPSLPAQADLGRSGPLIVGEGVQAPLPFRLELKSDGVGQAVFGEQRGDVVLARGGKIAERSVEIKALLRTQHLDLGDDLGVALRQGPGAGQGRRRRERRRRPEQQPQAS